MHQIRQHCGAVTKQERAPEGMIDPGSQQGMQSDKQNMKGVFSQQIYDNEKQTESRTDRRQDRRKYFIKKIASCKVFPSGQRAAGPVPLFAFAGCVRLGKESMAVRPPDRSRAGQ